MDLLQTVFLLLLLVALSGVIVGFLPQLPVPPLQVGLGAPAALPVAGVRLAFTLAGVLSVPLVLPDGSPFPGTSIWLRKGPYLPAPPYSIFYVDWK